MVTTNVKFYNSNFNTTWVNLIFITLLFILIIFINFDLNLNEMNHFINSILVPSIINKTKNNSLTYWKSISEKDVDQETNNPHILARRQLTGVKPVNVEIINLVLSNLKHSLSQEELNNFISIKPITIRFEDLSSIKIEEHSSSIYKNYFNKILRNKLIQISGSVKLAGVYVWTNIITGEQNVGSSTELYTRIRSYFKTSVLNSGKRLITKNMKEYGIENFKIDIYIIDTANKPIEYIRNMTLYFEQYYIFKLNPSLNLIKVAGSNQIVNFTEEHLAKIIKTNSKPVFVYFKKTLIYKASSSVNLIKEVGISPSTVNSYLKDNTKLFFKYFSISYKGPTKTNVIKFVKSKTLIDLFNKHTTKGKRTATIVKMKLIDRINDKTFIIDNASKALKFLASKGLSLSSKTLLKYKDTGLEYKGWYFYTEK